MGREVRASFTAGIIVGGSYSAQKMKFFIKDFFNKCYQTADLVTFTEEIFNGKLHFCAMPPSQTSNT